MNKGIGAKSVEFNCINTIANSHLRNQNFQVRTI